MFWCVELPGNIRILCKGTVMPCNLPPKGIIQMVINHKMEDYH